MTLQRTRARKVFSETDTQVSGIGRLFRPKSAHGHTNVMKRFLLSLYPGAALQFNRIPLWFRLVCCRRYISHPGCNILRIRGMPVCRWLDPGQHRSSTAGECGRSFFPSNGTRRALLYSHRTIPVLCSLFSILLSENGYLLFLLSRGKYESYASSSGFLRKP